MKYFRNAAIGVFGLALLCTATTANTQTVANGPYYATPSWDQTMPVVTRFVVLSNVNSEAVLDRETGLVWQRTPYSNSANNADLFTFLNAQTLCGPFPTGKRFGWRVPTRPELMSLYDPDTSAPALPAGSPFVQVRSEGAYSTSTPVAINGVASHVSVNFPNGSPVLPTSIFDDQSHLNVWCVRGPSAGGAE